MKSNLKGGNAIVRLLLAHGEKIGMVAILSCAFLLLWSAVGVPRLEQGKDPETLKRQADDAERHVNNFTRESIKEIDPTAIIELKEVKLDGMKPVDPEHFPLLAPQNPHVIPPQDFRTDPTLLTAEDLEVHGDAGLWASADPTKIEQRKLAAIEEKEKAEKEERARQAREQDDEGERGPGRRGRGERGMEEEESSSRGPNSTIVLQPRTGVELEGFEDIRAQSWVTVVARIPIKAQNQMYEDALQAARGFEPNRDFPVYLGYMIERAEVTSAGQGEWKNLATVTEANLINTIKHYPVNPEEVVDSRYVHPLMTHRLPPLILKEWDDRVSHSSMPLAAEADAMEVEAAEVVEEPKEDAPEEGDEMGFGATVQQPGQIPGGEYAERGGYGGGEYGGGRGGYGGGRGEYGGGRGGYGGGEYGGRGGGGYGGRGQMGEGSAVQLEKFEWDQKTASVLLRFFDNTVEPGHRYRYRVMLALQDVNNGVPVQYLDKSVTERREQLKPGRRKFRLTEWSKPSPIASVPLPARLYLVSADTAKVEAQILIKALNSEFAAEIALLDDFIRGAVMNLNEKAAVVWSNKYDVDRDPEFDFFTGTTLVDMQGGEKLSSKNNALLAPSRAVLMDAAGKMSIQRELKDAPVVEEFKAILESPPDERGGGGYGGEYGGGPGRGGRRGGF